MNPQMASALREVDWQNRAINRAIAAGWTVMHVRPTTPGRDTRRRTTATSVSGWPDLVLIHPVHGLAFVELKRVGGRLNPAQKALLPLLDEARTAEGRPDTVLVLNPLDEPLLLAGLETGIWTGNEQGDR